MRKNYLKFGNRHVKIKSVRGTEVYQKKGSLWRIGMVMFIW